MPRIALDLNKEADRRKVKATWRRATGLVPGELNEGLISQLADSPARLKEYDDTSWEVCPDIRESVSAGFTFAWYRITVEVPDALDGVPVTGMRMLFETNIDNYAEIWVDGQLDRAVGPILGINAQHRVEVTQRAVRGTRHVIACLAANGPLAEPRGGVYIRFATLAWESAG